MPLWGLPLRIILKHRVRVHKGTVKIRVKKYLVELGSGLKIKNLAENSRDFSDNSGKVTNKRPASLLAEITTKKNQKKNEKKQKKKPKKIEKNKKNYIFL